MRQEASRRRVVNESPGASVLVVGAAEAAAVDAADVLVLIARVAVTESFAWTPADVEVSGSGVELTPRLLMPLVLPLARTVCAVVARCAAVTRGWCPSAGTTLPSSLLPPKSKSVNLHDPSTTPVSPATKQFWASTLQVVLGQASSSLGSATANRDGPPGEEPAAAWRGRPAAEAFTTPAVPAWWRRNIPRTHTGRDTETQRQRGREAERQRSRHSGKGREVEVERQGGREVEAEVER